MKSKLKILFYKQTICLLILFLGVFSYGKSIDTKESDGFFFWKKNVNPVDFGAVGDGVADDSQAFQKAIDYLKNRESQVLNLDGEYIFNLNNKKISLNKRMILKFNGSIIKNAELIGDNTIISADPVKIFDNISLTGYFINTENTFVEWFGTYPNDSNSRDLKFSMEDLYKVYFKIKLNQGIYYTKIGNIEIKGLSGIAQDISFVEFISEKNNQHLFYMGKIGVLPEDRTYDSNLLKSISLVLNSKSKKIYNNSLLIIGGCHQAKIEDVKFIANSENVSLTSSELNEIYKDDKKTFLANRAINFNGGSELISFNNIFTLSDVGIFFTTGTDFANISNYSSWNGKNGLATVYLNDTSMSNVLFSGNQSWSQGLYGVYAKSSQQYTNFTNVKFENLRIEQLNENIKFEGKLVATSFWFGDYTYIPNLVFNNIMLAGTANGFRFGLLQDSRIMMENILVHHDSKAPRKFAFEAKLDNKGKSEISMQNVSLAPDIPITIDNSTLRELNISENKFINNSINTK